MNICICNVLNIDFEDSTVYNHIKGSLKLDIRFRITESLIWILSLILTVLEESQKFLGSVYLHNHSHVNKPIKTNLAKYFFEKWLLICNADGFGKPIIRDIFMSLRMSCCFEKLGTRGLALNGTHGNCVMFLRTWQPTSKPTP